MYASGNDVTSRPDVPSPTRRLAFRQMAEGDLDDMAALLGLQGTATEAAVACRDHARDVLDVKRLIAIVRPDNVPSQRVAEKIGLAYERDATFRTGGVVRIHTATL